VEPYVQRPGNRQCLWLVFLGAWLGACAMANAAPSSAQSRASPAQPLTQHQSLGKVRLTLSADRQSMGIADWLRLTLAVEAPSEMVVVFPRMGGTLGPFTVYKQRPIALLRTTSHTHQWQQEYTLAAERTGTLTIPPLTVAVQASGAAPVTASQQLTTEALSITVTPLLRDDADLTAPKDIAPPVPLAQPGLPLWLWGVGGLGGLGLLTGAWWGYRRWRTPGAAALQPAHILALEALRRLQGQDLSTRQRLDEFYVQLSDILRGYVRQRFGLRAPEQSTEELLAAVRALGGSIAVHHDLLNTFLQHCDLVKFAQYWPSPDHIRQDLERATAFVTQTVDHPFPRPSHAPRRAGRDA
jgi:BatD DUF11 like domain